MYDEDAVDAELMEVEEDIIHTESVGDEISPTETEEHPVDVDEADMKELDEVTRIEENGDPVDPDDPDDPTSAEDGTHRSPTSYDFVPPLDVIVVSDEVHSPVVSCELPDDINHSNVVDEPESV